MHASVQPRLVTIGRTSVCREEETKFENSQNSDRNCHQFRNHCRSVKKLVLTKVTIQLYTKTLKRGATYRKRWKFLRLWVLEVMTQLKMSVNSFFLRSFPWMQLHKSIVSNGARSRLLTSSGHVSLTRSSRHTCLTNIAVPLTVSTCMCPGKQFGNKQAVV